MPDFGRFSPQPGYLHIQSANTTLAATPETVASNAPPKVYRVFVIFTTIKYTLMV